MGERTGSVCLLLHGPGDLSMGQHAGSAQLEAEQGLSDPVEGNDTLHRNVLFEFHCV